MAGLNNTLSDTQQTTTTMPAWYDQAQQNIVSGGNTAAAGAPTFGQTTQQNAVNTLQGAANPFTQAQGTLQQISSGAANPWITDPTTGAVTPNTGTAMGGLFQAQQQELNQLMPDYSAPAEAGAIGSGNFGSLRGQTAVDKARGDAFAKLNAAQLQAALSNQQTGTQAATGLGNVGQQGINANMNVGAQQMNAPFQTIGNQASLLGTLQAPTTVSSQKQLSPLGQVATLGNAIGGGTAGLNSLLTSMGIKGGLSGLFSGGAATNTVSPTLPNGTSNPNFIGPVQNTVSPTLADGTPNPDFIGPTQNNTGNLPPVDTSPYVDPYAGTSSYDPNAGWSA